MFQLMIIKFTLGSGCKSTNFALVWFLSQVKSAMFTKVLWQGKRFITDLTGVRFLSRVNSASLGIPCRHRHPGASSPWGLASPGLRLPGTSPRWGSVAIPCWHRLPGASSVRGVSTSLTSSSPFLLLGEEAVCLFLSLGVGRALALGPWVTSL